ncbi:MAG: 2-aminoethanethiol dioxygenase-like [Trebouxia sp. A1-2]|nr:MAG: 2-aminoethanethiol dioxygenase-like [Trebouxia sp. A1-2]
MLANCFRPPARLSGLRAVATQPNGSAQTSKLQQLYQQALSSFGKGQQPKGPAEVSASDAESAPTRGLFGAWPSFQSTKRDSAITYIHIYEDTNMSIGMFCLPRNATIPLHNHPGMVVLSRVLYGQLHVKSYDWADGQQPNGQNGASSAAHLVMDEVVEAGSKPAIVFPTAGGNIHQFTAVTDCAVLDILAPPYSPQGGRDCTYYQAVGEEQDSNVRLVRSNPAPPLNMRNKRYEGVQIQPAITAGQRLM